MLSPEKTLVTPVTSTLRFLGHHLRVRRHPLRRNLTPRLVIPKDRSQRLRRTIERIFDRRTITETLADRLRVLNPVPRGWGYFYRHAWGAKRVFATIDAPQSLRAYRGPSYVSSGSSIRCCASWCA